MKIKEEELTTIREQQSKLNDLITQIGYLESQKHGLLHDIAGVNKQVEDFKKLLEKEYGSININLEDGSYTKIENEEEEIPVAAV